MVSPRPSTRDRSTPLYCLFSATAVGQVGNVMTIVAGPWFVLELTGRTTTRVTAGSRHRTAGGWR